MCVGECERESVCAHVCEHRGVCVCTGVCTGVYTGVCTGVCACVYNMSGHVFVYTGVCVHRDVHMCVLNTSAHVLVCTGTSMCVCVHTSLCVCVCVCAHSEGQAEVGSSGFPSSAVSAIPASAQSLLTGPWSSISAHRSCSRQVTLTGTC